MASLIQCFSPTNRFSFSATLFLSAALLFAVQPMLGKMLLPLAGGAPSGWLTALTFFQVALLAGYTLAHLLSRLSPRDQMAVTFGLLAAGFIFLPPQFSAAADDAGNAVQVLLLLLQSIALPYLALSTVSIGLQRLYASRGDAEGGSDPYFLYAASNAGSFIGLLTYPVLIEPLLPLSVQSQLWTAAYGVLTAMTGLLLFLFAHAGKKIEAQTLTPATGGVISWRQKLTWMVLAFVPSSLSMGLTALVTADIGSLPLFWVAPLGLYLLTFVIAFAKNRKVSSGRIAPWLLILAALQMAVFVLNDGILIWNWWFMVFPLAVFFATALFCHVRLAEQRPASAALTEFYLWLALGGALGGIFNVFLAPAVFPYPIEFAVTLSIAILFAPSQITTATRLLANIQYSITGVLVALNVIHAAKILPTWPVAPGLIAMVGFFWLRNFPRHFALVGLIAVLLSITPWAGSSRIAVARNFFGVATIHDRVNSEGETWRFFMHGLTIQGLQRMTPEPPDIAPRMNFSALTPLFAREDIKEVGMIGFGAGMSLCFKQPGRHFTVYEINPLMRELAFRHFTYIKECGEPEWRIGDGRIELQRDAEARYDAIIIDAFSSGSIPSHLLTREALAVYLQRLRTGGFVVLNINNRYYDFYAPMAALAYDAGGQVWRFTSHEDDILHGVASSNWVLLARSDAALGWLAALGWQEMPRTAFPVWRDDFTNILAAARIFSHAETH